MAIFKMFNIINGQDMAAAAELLTTYAEANILYSSAYSVIFSLPSYTNKIIMLNRASYSSANYNFSFADMYDSDGGIIGNKKILIPNRTLNYMYSFYLIVANNYVLMGTLGSDSSTLAFIVVGYTSTGRNVLIGCSADSAIASGFDSSTYQPVRLLNTLTDLRTLDNKLFKHPAMLLIGDEMSFSAGSPEIIEGLYCVSLVTGNNQYIVTPTGWFSPSGYYTDNFYIPTSLFVPL